MALARRLDEMQAEVLLRADIHDVEVQLGGLSNLNLILNASLRRLYRLLVEANIDLYLDSATVVVTSGEGPLPATFWRGQGVEAAEGSEWRALRRWSFSERNKFANASSEIWQAGYRIMGSKLRLFPAISGAVKVWFVPAPVTLSNPSDTFDGVAGLETWAILDAAIAIRQKFEEECPDLVQERQLLEAELRSSASERDDAEPDRIRDVDGEAEGDFWQIAGAST